MVRVSFRAQGNAEWQTGVAVARRGSQLLIQYKIQSGATRERWLPADRFSVPEGGDLSTLPVAPYERNPRSFKATLPDGIVCKMSSRHDQKRPAISYSVSERRTSDTETTKWLAPGWPKCDTRAEAEAYVAERLQAQANLEQHLKARGHAMNHRSEWAVVEVREHVSKR